MMMSWVGLIAVVEAMFVRAIDTYDVYYMV
jgi:hypothetical protein